MRPLILQELAEGMVIDYYETQNFDPDEHRLTHYRQVLEICSSLVSVSKVRYPYYEQPEWLQQKTRIEQGSSHDFLGELEVVQFAHFSVQEYMMLQRVKAEPRVSRYCFSPAAAHTSIVQLSLLYLLDLNGGVRASGIDFVAFPFLAYAAQFWPKHWVLQLPEPNQDAVNGLLWRLLGLTMDRCGA